MAASWHSVSYADGKDRVMAYAGTRAPGGQLSVTGGDSSTVISAVAASSIVADSWSRETNCADGNNNVVVNADRCVAAVRPSATGRDSATVINSTAVASSVAAVSWLNESYAGGKGNVLASVDGATGAVRIASRFKANSAEDTSEAWAEVAAGWPRESCAGGKGHVLAIADAGEPMDRSLVGRNSADISSTATASKAVALAAREESGGVDGKIGTTEALSNVAATTTTTLGGIAAVLGVGQEMKTVGKRVKKVSVEPVTVEAANNRYPKRYERQEGQYTDMSDCVINQVSAQSIDSITEAAASLKLQHLNSKSLPTKCWRSNHTFTFTLDDGTVKWSKALLSRCCSETGCCTSTTINFGWCPKHLHERKKITTGMSTQGENAGYGQFATSTSHSKVGFSSVTFREKEVVLGFDELMELTSHSENTRRYALCTGTYVAEREVRAETGEGFLPHSDWDKRRSDGLKLHAIYMDGARTRNPASLINKPSGEASANVGFCQEELKKGRYVLVALRDIMDGEELLWQYGSQYKIGKGSGSTSEYERLGAEATAYRERWLQSRPTEIESRESRVSAASSASTTIRPVGSNNSEKVKVATVREAAAIAKKAVLEQMKTSFFVPRIRKTVTSEVDKDNNDNKENTNDSQPNLVVGASVIDRDSRARQGGTP